MITYERSTVNEEQKVCWAGRSSSNDVGRGSDSQGKVVMESILETKASTILEFFAGLRGRLFVDLRRRYLGGLALRLAQAACDRGPGVQSAKDPTAETGQHE